MTDKVCTTALSNPFAWISLLIAIILVIGIICTTLYLLLRNKNINTKIFSATEKEKIQADSRELSDNQMRAAKIMINKLKIMMIEESDKLYPNKTLLEANFIDLLLGRITDNLLEQFRIDLVRNHIVKKNEDELKIYSQSKATMYYTKVEVYLSDYNRTMPEYNLKDIIKGIPEKVFFEHYYDAYKSAKDLSIGY